MLNRQAVGTTSGPSSLSSRFPSAAASAGGRATAPSRGGETSYRIAAFVLFHLLSAAIMVFVIASTPDPGGKFALIYLPGVTAQEAYLRAAAVGRPIRHGRVGWIVVVEPDPDGPDFAARALAAGAIAVLNPIVAGGCQADFLPTRPAPSG